MLNFNIIYNNETPIEDIRSALIEAGISINKEFVSLGVMNITAENETQLSSLDFIIQVEADDSVNVDASVDEPWHKLRLSTASLPLASEYKAVNAGEDSVVYLIDSGINADHTEFSEANIVNLYSHDDTFTDPTGHGTLVASVIVGKTLGAASAATLKVVKIPMGVSINISDLLEAFDAVLADHNLTPNNTKVVNCSWVIGKSQVLDAKIQELLDANLLVVASAGNYGADADNYSPVGYNSVLGVGASDAYDRVISWNEAGAISNWGEEVDVFAPGIDVTVAGNSPDEYLELSGTSIAAGITSAVACQWITMEPTHTAYEIQWCVIGAAQEDLLFRNETIYETTPNRVVVGTNQPKYFKTPRGTKLNVKRGEQLTITIETYDNPIIDRVELDTTTQLGPVTKNHPSWITRVSDSEYIASPPEDTVVGLYSFGVIALDSNDEPLSGLGVLVGVYETSEDELSEESEIYVTSIDADDNVIVAAQLCQPDTCFDAFDCVGAGTNCTCFAGNYCGTQGKE